MHRVRLTSVLLILSSLIHFNHSATTNSTSQCQKLLSKATKCAKGILFWNRDLPLESLDDMAKYCIAEKNNLECMQEYESCLSPFSRGMFSVGMTHMKRSVRRFCQSADDQRVFLRHFKCFTNDVNRRKPIQECLDRMALMVQEIQNGFQTADIYAGLCCTFTMYSDCIFNYTKAACDDVTGPATANYVQQILIKSVTSFVEMPCIGRSSRAECLANHQNLTRLIDVVFFNNQVPLQENSVIFPLLDIVSRFEVMP
ncbi:hypothetical protein HDE_10084 [Halotydeus destructor]|nr:hypothetical protein HDE_10084 [Halotydeus destructor]